MSFRALIRLMDDLNDLTDPFGSEIYTELHPVHPTRLRGLDDFPALKFIDCLGKLERGGPKKVFEESGEDDDCCFSLDVQDFKPEDISMTIVDNFVVVEGGHEEREDEHGFVSRHFKRRFTIPDGYDKASMDSTISSDGTLQISLKKLAKDQEPPKERLVQIKMVGPAKSPTDTRSAGTSA